MAEKHCNHCGNENQDSFAMELLKGYSAQAKRWFIACLVILSMWLATIGGFVWYLYQYDFESYETVIEGTQDGEGINIIGGGNIDYGTESKDNKAKTNP